MKSRLLMGGLTDEFEIIIKPLSEFESPTYLEIGVLQGGTFNKVLKHLDGNGFAHGVDLFEDLIHEKQNYEVGWPDRTQTHVVEREFGLNTSYRLDLDNALREKYTNFKLYKGYSNKIVSEIDAVFDVCFIDGNHTYKQTLLDFESCFNKSKVGTYFIFHNTTESEFRELYRDGGPYKVCNELMKNKNVEYLGILHTAKLFKRIK